METIDTKQPRTGNSVPKLAILLVVLTILAYAPVLRGGFIWDDDALITDNRMVKARDGLHRFWFTTEAPDYWPLTSSAWWLEWRLWGNHPTGYHAANVLLHAVNAVLVWAILWRLKVPGAWLAGCVFALHPVNVATAAWISEQKNTLSMFFFAVAILLYLRFYGDVRWRWYGLSLAAFLLGLLSKTAVVMLPVVLLGCVWWTRGRVRREDLLRSLPFFVLSLVMGLVTVWYQYPKAVGGHAIRTEGFFTRLAVAGLTPWFYLWRTLLPIDLMVIYPKWDVGASLWSSFVPGIILVGCLTLFWWRRKSWGRPLFFGLGCFVATLFPVSGFFHQTFHVHSFVADHWLYHSIAGVIALTVAGGVEICRRMGQRGRSVGAVAGAGVLIVLGAATWSRSSLYADSETLWRDNLVKNPGAWIGYVNLGLAMKEAGELEGAAGCYEQALRITPDLAEAHNNLGAILVVRGAVEEGIAHYRQALRIKADYAEAHGNLGDVLAQLGRIPEAIGHYEEALRLRPDLTVAHYNLGNILMQVNRAPEAVAHYEQALRIDPDYAAAHVNLGAALAKLGKPDDAIRHYEQALRIKPDYAEAHMNLGNALLAQGRVTEAMVHYEEALRVKPGYAEAHMDLGNALLTQGKVQGAIEHYEEALRIKPDYAEAHDNLGIALAQAGRVSEATKHWEEALRLNPDDVEAHCNLGNALQGQGRVAEAIEQFEQALKLRPDFLPAKNALTRLRGGP
jgi:tetratricopeptide (TPR) repeat protein